MPAREIKKRNIPIFGPERYSFLEALKQYTDVKAAYDGYIAKYGRLNYNIRSLEVSGGTIPVRTQFFMDEIRQAFSIREGTDEAIGFEFDIPIRKGHKANISAELWSWAGERLASTQLTEVYYNDQNESSMNNPSTNHHIFVDNGRDEYVFVTLVLNKEKASDLENPETFLQNKIKTRVENTSSVTNRLFILRVKLITWDARFSLDTSDEFECRDDSIVIEVFEDEMRS